MTRQTDEIQIRDAQKEIRTHDSFGLDMHETYITLESENNLGAQT